MRTLPLLKSTGQFLINPVKAAVGQNGHYIPRLQPGSKSLHDSVRGWVESRVVTRMHQRVNHLLGMHSLRFGDTLLLEDSSYDNPVRQREALHQLTLEHISAQRIGSRFEHGPESLPRIGGAQSFQGLANRGRVMGEIIDDRDSSGDGAHLEPALYAAEGGKGLDDRGGIDSLPRSQGGSRSGVERVVLSRQRQGYLQPFLTGAKNLPT